MLCWELFLSDRVGISPPSLPLGKHGLRSDALQQLVWGERTNTHAHMVQFHKNVISGSEKEVKLPGCYVCDPDFSGALRLQLLRQTSLLLWIHEGWGLCSNVCYRNKVIYMYGKKWSHFLFLCVSHSFHPSGLPSLAAAVSVYYLETRHIRSTALPVIPSSFSRKLLQFAPFCCKPHLVCLSISLLCTLPQRWI